MQTSTNLSAYATKFTPNRKITWECFYSLWGHVIAHIQSCGFKRENDEDNFCDWTKNKLGQILGAFTREVRAYQNCRSLNAEIWKSTVERAREGIWLLYWSLGEKSLQMLDKVCKTSFLTISYHQDCAIWRRGSWQGYAVKTYFREVKKAWSLQAYDEKNLIVC